MKRNTETGFKRNSYFGDETVYAKTDICKLLTQRQKWCLTVSTLSTLVTLEVSFCVKVAIVVALYESENLHQNTSVFVLNERLLEINVKKLNSV